MAADSPNAKCLISGNWKMHHNHLEAIQAIQKLGLALTDKVLAAVEVSIHPPFTSLRSVQTVVDADNMIISLGAQNCHFEDSGPFTGEVSPAMLAKLHVRYVIVGHSERRAMGETDEIVRSKVIAVLRNNMTPILCVGESVVEREEGSTADRLRSQVSSALKGLGASELSGIVVAYEPIWAIGTGRSATAQDAAEAAMIIRQEVSSLAGEDVGSLIRVQYGGSVGPDNVVELLAPAEINGALVGGASLDPATFSSLIQAVAGSLGR